MPPAPRAIPALRDLAAPQTGKYYILDFFSGVDSKECPHGKMVLDAATRALAEYGATQFAGNIEEVNVDFYSDKKKAEKQILKYIGAYADRVRPSLNKFLETIMTFKRDQANPLAEPVFFLQALYDPLVLDPDAAVISTSFWTDFDGFSWIPPNYSDDSDTVLLTAVLDDEPLEVENSSSFRKEPLHTFWLNQGKLGIGLVGSERSPGVAAGMHSAKGDGVTNIERGYDLAPADTCLGKARGGTSFATPRIGVQFLLARLFWKAKLKVPVHATEAKLRLLLASDVAPAYVGQYASGGIPRLERVLQDKRTFAVARSGELVDVMVKDESFLDLKVPGHSTPDTLRFRRGKFAVCGIQVIEGQLYIFPEADLMWEKAPVDKFRLIVVENGQENTLTSPEEFARKYKVLVTYEN